MANRLHRLIRRFRRGDGHAACPIWEGVYSTFDEVPQSGEGFRSDAAAAAAEALLRETQSDPMPAEAALDHHVLALAARLIEERPVKIADFGGGVGQSYAALRRMLEIPLRYRVIDLPSVVEHASRLWNESELSFATSLDMLTFAPDVVFAKGVIQYWPDYAAFLRSLFATKARFVLLEKVPMMIGRDYVTVQRDVYGARVPYWFTDLNVLTRVAREENYRLVLQRRLEREYDQSNFPPELRSGRAASLLFER